MSSVRHCDRAYEKKAKNKKKLFIYVEFIHVVFGDMPPPAIRNWLLLLL